MQLLLLKSAVFFEWAIQNVSGFYMAFMRFPVVMRHDMARRDMVFLFSCGVTWHDMSWFPVFMSHDIA